MDRIEVIDDQMAEVLKNKTPQERLMIAFEMWESTKKMLTNFLYSEYPEWNQKQIHNEVVKRMSHGSIRLT